MSSKVTLSDLRERMIQQSLKDMWWLARNGVTYRSPMSLQAIELTLKKNPQGDYQVCHVRDDGEDENCWFELGAAAAPVRKVESRGNTTIFRAAAPGPKTPMAFKKPESPSPFPAEPVEKPSIAKTQKSVSERMDEMEEILLRLESKVDKLLSANDLIAQLEQRERYLREAEEMVAEKANALENERHELEQERDELEQRKFRTGSA
ncbi:hypothetical protein [Cerasicoccus fimbriatus]|uniref:hypothetical protein n=1 Tax=Cerasicoccus fimbriatus TaxID=3014554 RepID=UPI0022B4D7A8|nr:hypothetical protein [Cerasicoccus sp. TK19100]